MSEWMPIESAPKNGAFVRAAAKSSWITAFDHFPYPFPQRWNGAAWEANDGRIYEPQPTHWQAA